MINIVQGDIFVQNTEALVNPVNCVGVMGKGLALQFKTRFSENFRYYKTAVKNKLVAPGKMLVYEVHGMENPKYIVNFPTKTHWREDSRYEHIESGLKDLVTVINDYSIRSISIPPLGCGLGGLNWNQVCPMIVSALSELPDVEVLIFEPKSWDVTHGIRS